MHHKRAAVRRTATERVITCFKKVCQYKKSCPVRLFPINSAAHIRTNGKVSLCRFSYFELCGAAGCPGAGAEAGNWAAVLGAGAVCCAAGLAAPSISDDPLCETM